VIIGGGQVGLATGYHLKRRGMEHVILDAGERIGDPWRGRWPSLRLYTPAKYDGLPGMRFPGRGFAFPSTNEMADYLEAYSERFELPVRTGVHVDSLSRQGELYEVRAGERRFRADNVVVASGVMQVPVVPQFASLLARRITQLHSNDYRGPEQLRPGRTLVVGASHSGGDIAWELARTHPTILAGRDTGQLPFSVESRRARLAAPVLKRLALHVLTVDTPIGRKMKPEIRSHGAPLLRYRKADLEAAGVERVLARVAGVQDGLPVLEGGRVLDVANVIWCTGFHPGHSWIDLPVFGSDGEPRHERGVVTSEPGLYFVGRHFIYSASSTMIHGVGRDAEHVVKTIATRTAEAGERVAPGMRRETEARI
jgi:putative flavoprotein involved in K+ transport